MTKGTIGITNSIPTILLISVAGILLNRARSRNNRTNRPNDDDDYDDDNAIFESNSSSHTRKHHRRPPPPPPPIAHRYEDLIGKTPVLHLPKLSSHLPHRRSIYVKMESCNPGGTGKDRAALFMLNDAEERGLLPPPIPSPSPTFSSHSQTSAAASPPQHTSQQQPSTEPPPPASITETPTATIQTTIQKAIKLSRTGGIVVEGTSGSTGISLATLCAVRGHSIIVVMPDDQAQEKRSILNRLGAVVHVVPTASISNAGHYVNVARRIASGVNDGLYGGCGEERICAFFTDQFENRANYRAHVETTGPELWEQMDGDIDVFCMSGGTGATISGTGRYLKDRAAAEAEAAKAVSQRWWWPRTTTTTTTVRPCRIVLIDPPGSVLYNKIKFNVAYATEQRERNILRHRYDTIAEGIGLDRITQNFALGVEGSRRRVIDDAVRVSDQEAVDMAHWLLRYEGIFVGSSSAMNVVGALRVAIGGGDGDGSSSLSLDDAKGRLGHGARVVTVICDGGQRHLTRFWNRDFVLNWGLLWPGDDTVAWMERLPSCLSSNVQ